MQQDRDSDLSWPNDMRSKRFGLGVIAIILVLFIPFCSAMAATWYVKSNGSEFGPSGSVRDRFRLTEPFRFFDLLTRCSVSRFGIGFSVDGSVGSVLGYLQVTEKMRILFV